MLLSAAASAIEPIASSSIAGKKLVSCCKDFYVIAKAAVERNTAQSQLVAQNAAPGEVAYNHIMAPQDWDTVMHELELGMGAGEMAAFVEPYMPFDGRPV